VWASSAPGSARRAAPSRGRRRRRGRRGRNIDVRDDGACAASRVQPGWRSHRSDATSVMPMEPKGTRPISTLWPRAARTRARPGRCRRRTTREHVTSPRRHGATSRPNGVMAVRKIEPKNHIHEMPSSEWNTVRSVAASFRLRQVSLNGFQLMPAAARARAKRDEVRHDAAEDRDGDAGRRDVRGPVRRTSPAALRPSCPAGSRRRCPSPPGRCRR
jgi:hypothetical protein